MQDWLSSTTHGILSETGLLHEQTVFAKNTRQIGIAKGRQVKAVHHYEIQNMDDFSKAVEHFNSSVFFRGLPVEKKIAQYIEYCLIKRKDIQSRIVHADEEKYDITVDVIPHPDQLEVERTKISQKFRNVLGLPKKAGLKKGNPTRWRIIIAQLKHRPGTPRNGPTGTNHDGVA